MGLIAAATSQTAHVPVHVTGAILIGVDLGPVPGYRFAHHHTVAIALRREESMSPPGSSSNSAFVIGAAGVAAAAGHAFRGFAMNAAPSRHQSVRAYSGAIKPEETTMNNAMTPHADLPSAEIDRADRA